MSENIFFVDFHCHATLRALNTVPSGDKRNIWEKTFNPQLNNPIGRWARLQTREISKESQSNFYDYVASNTRVILDSLYPIEKGWFKFRKLPSYIVGEKARESLTLVAFGIEKSRLYHLIKNKSYFEELIECYKFLKEGQGLSPDGNYAYKLASNYQQIQDIVNNEPYCLAVVVNIEGAHALECGNPYINTLSLKKHKKLLSKNINILKAWEFPPFTITLAHHFWNELCGHARSMKSPISLVFNQSLGLNAGITELGWHVIEELLSRKNGKRILIDTKHMSVKSRQEYYSYIIAHNAKYPEDKIPVICSHGSINGFSTMEESMKSPDNSRKLRGSYFNNWGINLSNEEIKIIHDSGGRIGIMLDKSLLGGTDTLKVVAAIPGEDERKKAFVRLMLDNIFWIVKVIGNKSAWDIITLGSDFDGLITHIDCYENASKIGCVRNDLISFLSDYRYFKELWYDYTPEEIINKIFSDNSMSFLKEHFK